jgi:bifunctional enzyme CysN/CysC
MPVSAVVQEAPSFDDGAAEAHRRGALRFITCGSVDDGKSTLIGRLLHEARAIFEDQERSLAADSRRFGTVGDEIDYALLVDGLEAEREQGITIDVAYRFFATPRRSFIVADTPGHAQYTRNMATGASGAELAVLLVDVRAGIIEQTRRHAAIVDLLGVRHVVLAVNKMDLVDFDEAAYRKVVADFEALARNLDFASAVAIPVSARYGDNVTQRSERMPWYSGPALLDYLETIRLEQSDTAQSFRFPVQYVSRPDSHFRGFAGTVAGGRIAVGDPVVVAGSGRRTNVSRIVTMDGDRTDARDGDAVTLVLADPVDVGRGEVLSDARRRPDVARNFSAHLVWMSASPARAGRRYSLKLGTRTVEARLTSLEHRIDITTLDREDADRFGLNEIGVAHIETFEPIAFDSYADNRITGAFILIDPVTRETAGAGMIVAPLGAASNVHFHAHEVSVQGRAHLKNQVPLVVWLTGLPGSGKSTIANLAEQRLHSLGFHTMLLDGDNLRKSLNRDLGFGPEARHENVRRTGEVARLMVDAGLIVFCALVSPFRADREHAASLVPAGRFLEVFVDAPVEVCMARDPKGLYEKAAQGRIADMTGVGQHYEPPTTPALRIDTQVLGDEQAADKLLRFLLPLIRPSAADSLDAAGL